MKVAETNATQTLADSLNTRRSMMTAPEVAELLSVNVKTVYAWAKQGRLKTTNISGAVRFDPHLIAEYIRGKTS